MREQGGLAFLVTFTAEVNRKVDKCLLSRGDEDVVGLDRHAIRHSGTRATYSPSRMLGPEAADEHQGLEVISETAQCVFVSSLVGPTFERVAHFQLAIVRTSHVFVPVNGPSTIRPVIATGSHA
jgi:hypothetical protein